MFELIRIHKETGNQNQEYSEERKRCMPNGGGAASTTQSPEHRVVRGLVPQQVRLQS